LSPEFAALTGILGRAVLQPVRFINCRFCPTQPRILQSPARPFGHVVLPGKKPSYIEVFG